MSSINTGGLIEKLERIIDFRIGEKASERCPVILRGDASCPATDGTQIFLPRKESHFVSERDNELSLANSTAHEGDHIREIESYFGAEVEVLREQKANLVQEFHQRNYLELKENPALAGWIDNIVKDRRIDAQRREQLPGVKKYYEESLAPAAEYFRPSTKGMSELDAFREQYLQKSLIGRVVEPIPKKHTALLEEVVSITDKANSINQDREVVSRIYKLFKENFDISQPISRLPPKFGTSDHSKPLSGQPQQGYGKEVKPREGRLDEGEGPKKLGKGKEKSNKPNEEKEGTNGGNEKDKDAESSVRDKKDDANFYERAQKKYEINVFVVKAEYSEDIFRNKYSGEIESMKRIFRQLQLRHYGEKRDSQGQELDYADYMQSELEARVTGIKGNGRYFRAETQNQQRPTFGIHADVSGSTKGTVIEQIRAALYIIGNSLSTSDWNYGLYASADNLAVLKEPSRKWTDEINYNIMRLRAGGTGIFLAQTSSVISEDLKRVDGNPKCLIVISDFDVCGEKAEEIRTAKKLQDQKIYPFYIAIGKEHEKNAREMAQEIGDEHFSVIPTDRLYELPGEMFRLFKTYGVAR